MQLAALIGVTPNTIQNWEKPNGLKQLERYLKMAELFGCAVEDLVEYVPGEASEGTPGKSREFSLEDVRELRERWGTATRSKTSKPQDQDDQLPGSPTKAQEVHRT